MNLFKPADAFFEAAYHFWLNKHIRNSSGERRRRLKQGLGDAELLFVRELWWPAFGNFDGLHPEYEVRDFKDGSRFLDFAYLKPGLMVCIEIDPYGTHYGKISRWQYDDNLERHNDLVIDGWKILRFSRDQLVNQPRRCQLKIQQALGKWESNQHQTPCDHPIDRAIVQVMSARAVPMSPIEIARELGWDNSTISKHLKQLLNAELVLPEKAGRQRNKRYVLNRTRIDLKFK